jgi:Na+/proline symporter
MTLGVLDWLIVALYFACILAIGWRSMRRVRDAGGFLLGNRKLGTGMMIASTFAGGINANHPVSVAANTYVHGLSGMWLSLAYILATPIFWMWPPALRRLRLVTIVDFFRLRYGRVMEWYNLVAAVLIAPFGFGVGIKAASLLVVAVAGSNPDGSAVIGPNLAIAMIVIPTVFYTLLGGIFAAYAVDMLQSVLIVILSFLLLPFLVWKAGGMLAVDAAATAHSADIWNLLGTQAGGISPVWLFWFAVSLFFSAPMVYGGGSGAARTEMAARFAVIGNLAKRLCTVGWGLTGVFAIALFAGVGVAPENVFASACVSVLPPGLRGLMVSAMLAAVMSTIAGMMLNFGGNMVNNLYKDHFVRDASPRHYLLMARVFTGGSVFLGWLVAASDLGLVHIVVIVEQVGGMLGVTVLAALMWRRVTAAGAIAAASVMAPLFICGNLSATHWPAWYEWLVQRILAAYSTFGIHPGLDAGSLAAARPEQLIPLTTPLYLLSGLAVIGLVSLFTRQHDTHHVAEFYARLDTPLGREADLRRAGFRADTLEELDGAQLDAAAPHALQSDRLLLVDFFTWPRLVLTGRARLRDYWIDVAGIVGALVFIAVFLAGISLLVTWLRT